MNKSAGAQLPIVGIGASAGGIEAFQAFFENMPADNGLGFVVILHLPSTGRSLLPDILRRWTRMQVVAATEGCLVEANRIYVPPPGRAVRLREGRLYPQLAGPDATRDLNPIDIFFDSLAAELEEDAIGVILSGTGSDGALGLKAIKSCGGLTCAQGPDGHGPSQEGMPISAIATGAVDIVAAAEAMPGRIVAAQRARARPKEPADMPPEDTDTARLAICAELNKQTGHDFAAYKTRTFLRRVQRRMNAIGLASLAEYQARITADFTEGPILLRELLVSVTSFFRDADTFDIVRDTVMPILFKDKDASHAIRVWVPGCATGEEAYSLAILFREYTAQMPGASPRIQIFATDIDDAAIATARAGRYPSTLLQGMPLQRRARFFSSGTDGSFTVTKEVRDLCTFSTHSLTRDPPFSRMDMVSCRNILIYLDTELQSLVVPAFHYALVTNGVLLLGSSETVSRNENLFAALDRRHRIFQRRDVSSPPLPLGGRGTGRVVTTQKTGSMASSRSARTGITRMMDRVGARLQERFTPAFVVVSADGEILQFSGRTGRFLEAAPGAPNQNALVMVRLALRGPLRVALKKAAATGEPAESLPVAVDTGQGTRRIAVAVEPLTEPGSETIFLVVFMEAGASENDEKNAPAGAAQREASEHQLEAELRDAREQLQSFTEEHVVALEELRSANEELNSVNEELQSTNEELETSREEIQSVNEELQTVNSQLASKVDELDSRNNDLKNLFDSTEVATIFLDPYFVIRGYTPAIASLYNLIPSDIGRPLSDIVTKLRYRALQEDVRRVLNTLEPLEMRVTSEDEATHYLMRILPYRTPASKVDGTLVTFVDVTSIVQAEQHQRLLVDELNHRVKNMLTAVISLADQTIRRAGSLDDFTHRYMGRLHALSAAYSLVSAEIWQTVSLRDVLMEELKPFVAEDHGNATLQGPRIMLSPRSSLALSMAVHELTTNAVKYGALSVPEGRVAVTWRVEQTANGDRLHLEWNEHGGPQVKPPSQRGFGMTLIERGLKQEMDAHVMLEFDPGGVQAKIQAPLQAAAPPNGAGAYGIANP